MSTTYGTGGYVTKANGDVLTYVLPKGTLVSAQVKFRGKAVSFYDYQTRSNSASGSGTGGHTTSIGIAIAIPSGYTFVSGSATSTVTSSSSGTYSVSASIGGAVASQSGSGTGATVTANALASASSSGHSALHDAAYTYAFSISTQWRKLLTSQTHDPHVHIGAAEYGYTGDLNNGVETAWYDIAASVSPDSTATITVNVDGSYAGAPDAVDVYVEIVMIVALQSSTDLPLSGASVARDSLVFYASPIADADDTNTVWYPRLQANTELVWTSPDFDIDSHSSQTGWEYWTGAAWAALPGGGAPIAAQCRYTPPTPTDWPTKRHFWRVAAWDSIYGGIGDWSAAIQVRVMLAVLQNFAAEIDSTDVSARVEHLRVALRKNGSLSDVQFDLRCYLAGESVPVDLDSLDVSISDADGDSVQWNGWVEGTPNRAGPGYRRVFCCLHDAKLAYRVATADIASQDLGQSLKDLVDTYATELDSSNIDVTLGLSRPLECVGKTLNDLFREVCKETQADFWVDSSVDPPEVWVVRRADLGTANYSLLSGTPPTA